MALIQCKYCEKNVSDKAKNCPHCGGLLIEENLEVEQAPEAVLCEECGTEIPEGATTCPNCGCPVPEKIVEDTTQKVEVTAVNLQMKKSTKKYYQPHKRRFYFLKRKKNRKIAAAKLKI